MKTILIALSLLLSSTAHGAWISSNCGPSCMEVACDLLGPFGCDQLSQVEKVGHACRGADGQCVQTACNHLGTFGCDELQEIERVANACSEN